MRRQQKYHEPKCGSGFATLKEISMTVEKLHLNYSIACLTKKWKKLNPSLAKKSFLKGLMKQQQKFLTISSSARLMTSCYNYKYMINYTMYVINNIQLTIK